MAENHSTETNINLIQLRYNSQLRDQGHDRDLFGRVRANPSILYLEDGSNILSYKIDYEQKYLSTDGKCPIAKSMCRHSMTYIEKCDRQFNIINTVKLCGFDARLLIKNTEQFLVYTYISIVPVCNLIYTLDNELNILSLGLIASRTKMDKNYVLRYNSDGYIDVIDFMYAVKFKISYEMFPFDSENHSKLMYLCSQLMHINTSAFYRLTQLLEKVPKMNIFDNIKMTIVNNEEDFRYLSNKYGILDANNNTLFSGSSALLSSNICIVHYKNIDTININNVSDNCDLYPLQSLRECNQYYPIKGYINSSQSKSIQDDECMISDEANIKKLLFIIRTFLYSKNLNKQNVLRMIENSAFPNRHYVSTIYYYNFFCKLSSDLLSFTISQPFAFITCSTTGVNFVCGCAETPTDYIVTYSTDDANAFIKYIPKEIIKFNKLYDFFDILFIDESNIYTLHEFINTFIQSSVEKQVYNKLITSDIYKYNPDHNEISDVVGFLNSKLNEVYTELRENISPEIIQRCFRNNE